MPTCHYQILISQIKSTETVVLAQSLSEEVRHLGKFSCKILRFPDRCDSLAENLCQTAEKVLNRVSIPALASRLNLATKNY